MRPSDQNAFFRTLRGDGQAPAEVAHPGDARVGDDARVDGGSEHQVAAAAVVAEAVALALEEVAAEAAEAVLVTATAVAEASRRASEAAEVARQARADAAAAAAQSVALEAARSAARVQQDADHAAARVRQAASHAADEFADSIVDAAAQGAPLDVAHISELLAATVSAAALAATHETRRAASDIAHATDAAAARVTQSVAAAAQAAEHDVMAAADSEREIAAVTAAAMAVRTDAVAVGVATAARDAAAALVVDELAVTSAGGILREQQPTEGPRAGGGSAGTDLADLAAQVSHDLLVPLSSIVASMELLSDELGGHPDETVAALLDTATRASDRMVQMLNQNMTSNAVTGPAGKPTTDLADIARQIVGDSADLLRAAGAAVEVGRLPTLRAHSGEMYSVLQNLITNSIKFASPGVPAVVQISARRSVHGWRITVRDNGRGLPHLTELNVFSPYSRGTHATPGHGIGLATVARIIAANGGQVGTVHSTTGAEIWFEMPDYEAVPQSP